MTHLSSVQFNGIELSTSDYSVSKEGVLTFHIRGYGVAGYPNLRKKREMKRKIDDRPYYRRFDKVSFDAKTLLAAANKKLK